MKNELPQTDFLVLRISPCGDDAVVAAGVSPELGRAGFLVRNNNPMRGLIDMFQIVTLTYRCGRGELYYPADIDFGADYRAVIKNEGTYRTACEIAAFALRHCAENAPMPDLFKAMQVALIRLCNGHLVPEALMTCVGLTFLREGGWLAPDRMPAGEGAQCEFLLRMASGGDIPALTDENWRQLWEWTQFCIHSAEA